MTLIPLLLYWTIALWGLTSRRPVLLYLFFGSFPFGSFAVIPPSAIGGLTIIPTTMTLVFLVVKVFSNERNLLTGISSVLDPRRLGILFAFWIVAAVTTLFMPRLFAGSVLVIPMRGDVSVATPLAATPQNISQLAYLTLSIIGACAFAQILKAPHMRQTALHGYAFGAALLVLTGLLDFASQHVPIKPVLDVFRTGTYSFLVEVEVLGSKRIVGLMPEASTYGSTCVTMLCVLYFSRRALQSDYVRDIYVPVLLLLLLLFAWLSTSSAAYIGIVLFLFVATIEWTVRFVETHYNKLRRRHLGSELLLVFLAA
ncbi:hypothetical protein ACFSM9_00590, partial [Microvirga arabica]